MTCLYCQKIWKACYRQDMLIYMQTQCQGSAVHHAFCWLCECSISFSLVAQSFWCRIFHIHYTCFKPQCNFTTTCSRDAQWRLQTCDIESNTLFWQQNKFPPVLAVQMPSQGSVLEPNSPLLKLDSHTFQNAVDKNSWKVAAFSSDVEYVSAASAHKSSHHIYIWNRLGILERILEGKLQPPSCHQKNGLWRFEGILLSGSSLGNQ